MKDPLNRTKVVLRHLPPSISQQAIMEQIDGRFDGTYDWACFRPGKSSLKEQRFSRVYLNFKKMEDVIEFAEFFNGHMFVNEKGGQFKALVEYAPSQRVPKPHPKKDGREGTLVKDPEYLEFLEYIAKPVENLPSAEIQLERKEAERAAAGKETPIVTPLMFFVRQKRAAKNGAQRSSGSTRLSRKAAGISAGRGSPSKRGSEKHRNSTSTYVLRDGTKDGSFKDKPTVILVHRREERPGTDKTTAASSTIAEVPENDITASVGAGSGSSVAAAAGKNKIVLLKGKAREGSHASDGSTQQQMTSSAKYSSVSPSKHDHCLEASVKIYRSVLSQSYVIASQPEQDIHAVNFEKDKRPPRPPNVRAVLRDQISESNDKSHFDGKHSLSPLHGSVSAGDKIDRHARSKDRPDRGVWTLRRSDRSHSGGVALSSASEPMQTSSESVESSFLQEYGHGERKRGIPGIRRDEIRSHGSSRGNPSPAENGSHRHVNRRGLNRGSKELDNSGSVSEGKHSKRGPPGYGAHERQVWVQKPGSAT